MVRNRVNKSHHNILIISLISVLSSIAWNVVTFLISFKSNLTPFNSLSVMRYQYAAAHSGNTCGPKYYTSKRSEQKQRHIIGIY